MHVKINGVLYNQTYTCGHLHYEVVEEPSTIFEFDPHLILNVRDHIRRYCPDKIMMIKLIRSLKGCGLLEAKHLYEFAASDVYVAIPPT